MSVGIFHDIISPDNHLARYNVIHSIINSVKMPLGIWACHRVAVTFLKWTYFVLRCKSNSFHMKPVIPQNGISILRNSPCYRLGSQIKYLVCHLLSKRLNSRKHSRKSLPYTGRRLNIQIRTILNSSVYTHAQILLPLPVFIRKLKFSD